MLKRFVVGFVVGWGAMYWYIHHSTDTLTSADRWMQRSASQYRDDKVHQAVDEQTGRSKR